MVPKQARVFLAETLGTFMFFFAGYFALAGSTTMGSGSVPHIVISLGFGLGLLAALFAFGEISGGHFNPAVSLAMWLSRRLSLKELISYWIAQVVGGIGAGVFVFWITNRLVVKGTTTQPGNGISVTTALLVEVLLTAIFVVVILEASQKGLVGFIAIPLTLVVVHLVGVPLTGASVNPARSLGSALVGGNWHAFWIYVAGPALGAVVAWLVHTVVIRGEKPGMPKTA